MNDWQTIDTAPEGIEVDTKIDDKKGERNVQSMKRSGNMWFIDNGMYVYYRPTHWRTLSAQRTLDATQHKMGGSVQSAA